MPPIGETITGLVIGKSTDQLIAAFRTYVFDPMTKKRAQAFFDTFIEAVHNPETSARQLDEFWQQMFSKQENVDLLFEAYRAVCLTKSKTTGPKVIALLIAQIVMERRIASEAEEQIMEAAEELSDTELSKFEKYVSAKLEGAKQKSLRGVRLDKGGELHVEVVSPASTRLQDGRVPLTPLDLATALGTWATKLQRLGLIHTNVLQGPVSSATPLVGELISPTSARPENKLQVTRTLRFPAAALQLASVVEKAACSAIM